MAPETQQSAASHSLTLHRPLRIRRISKRRHAVNGTPTDCVFLAFNKIMADGPPDLVLSGVNDGPNVGEDVTYSGTIAAAMEATLFGAPAVALSQAYGDGRKHHWATAEQWAGRLLPMLIERGWPKRVLINVNFPDLPAAEVRGIKVVRQGLHALDDTLEERIDPRGRPYYWIGAQLPAAGSGQRGTDMNALDEGYVSVTPASHGSHPPADSDLAAGGHRMMRHLRETGLIAPVVGASLMAAMLVGMSACAELKVSVEELMKQETAQVDPVPAAPRVGPAPEERMPPPFEAAKPQPPPREKPALLLTVGAGDTVSEIAHRYGVATVAIIKLNGLTYPYWLQTGQRLRLPEKALVVAQHRAPTGETPPFARNGTTVAGIEAEPAASARVEPKQPARTVTAAPAPSIHVEPVEPAPSVRAGPAAPEPPRSPSRRVAQAEPEATPPRPTLYALARQSGPDHVPLPPTRNTFLWPLEGRVISGFGAKPGGKHNDGINIAVPVGSEVRASQNGVVAYAGNELRGTATSY